MKILNNRQVITLDFLYQYETQTYRKKRARVDKGYRDFIVDYLLRVN